MYTNGIIYHLSLPKICFLCLVISKNNKIQAARNFKTGVYWRLLKSFNQ
jgi:hypothetical protein